MEYIVDKILGEISYLNLAYLHKKWAETLLATFVCCVNNTFSTVSRLHDNQSQDYMTNKRRNGNAGAQP